MVDSRWMGAPIASGAPVVCCGAGVAGDGAVNPAPCYGGKPGVGGRAGVILAGRLSQRFLASSLTDWPVLSHAGADLPVLSHGGVGVPVLSHSGAPLARWRSVACPGG
ncbi:hypothetical protein GCM10022226_31150 [Sphaerisporangium flaviroseum]|uniref:Uncharacterized protein n=1 Tax=Sphaerisporangium flaviroseum TaxID=509199 RepID=A0ABP7I210_9ACTN